MGMPEPGEGLCVQLDDFIEFSEKGIVSKTITETEAAKVLTLNLAAGEALSDHTANSPAVIHVLQGTGIVKLGKTDHEVGPGTWIYMPSGLNHAVTAKENIVLLLTLLRG